MNRTIAWAFGITLAGVAFAGACGNTVSDTSGSGGNGGKVGSGGSPATSTVTTGATGGSGGSGGVSGTGGSSDGGGDACDMACKHAAKCGADICDQFPGQVDCSTKAGMCLAGCVGPASCADLNKAIAALMMNPPDIADSGPVGLCAVGCLEQGGTGGSGQGGNPGAGGAGGSGSSCKNCAEGACQSQIGACARDMSAKGCLAWLECANGCNFDPQCTAACDTTDINGATLYDPVYTCACNGQCPGCADVCTAHAGEGSSTGTN